MQRIVLAAAALLVVASCAEAAFPENAYLWIHPKLGPILVDKASNAPVGSAAAKARESTVATRTGQSFEK